MYTNSSAACEKNLDAWKFKVIHASSEFQGCKARIVHGKSSKTNESSWIFGTLRCEVIVEHLRYNLCVFGLGPAKIKGLSKLVVVLSKSLSIVLNYHTSMRTSLAQCTEPERRLSPCPYQRCGHQHPNNSAQFHGRRPHSSSSDSCLDFLHEPKVTICPRGE